MAPIPAHILRNFAAQAFKRVGLKAAAAALVADSLVQADLWGHPSHGVLRIFWYTKRLETRAVRADAVPKILTDAGALLLLDGQDGMGQVIADQAMSLAIERARQHGIGAVSVRNGGHFGTAMYFTHKTAAQGCIGYLATNASPAMAPWGGREKRLGTNPWSWAAPAGRYPTMMLDIANTAVARGKLYVARDRGEAIPDGWAIDESGRATTDPDSGLAGTILPMAGHKGYAIAAVTDMLSGILAGSAFGTSIAGPYVPEGRSGAGHLAIAIDIEKLRPLAAFKADMDTLIDQLKSAERAPGVDEILYPGEPEARHAARAEVEGIDLPSATRRNLVDRATALGLSIPPELL